MKIELTKESNTHHRLRCMRDDGSVEEASLETKSFLVHDFTHLAYELEANLTGGFWGLVAAGKGFMELREPMRDADPNASELVQTEMIVGPLQSVVQEKRPPVALLEGLENAFSAHEAELPDFLTIDFIERVKGRFKKLYGEWYALPFGETMRIEWAS